MSLPVIFGFDLCSSKVIGFSMQYRTEIHIAPDRYVCLQLPDFIPEGRATVTVSITLDAERVPLEFTSERESDANDIEWWEEFDGENPRRS